MASAMSCGMTPSRAFTVAAADLINASARICDRSRVRNEMGKFSTARWVCAWYLAFFGTRTSPMVSCSMRYSMSTVAVGDVAVVDVVVVVAALGRNSPLCSAMPVTLAGRIAAGPAERGPDSVTSDPLSHSWSVPVGSLSPAPMPAASRATMVGWQTGDPRRCVTWSSRWACWQWSRWCCSGCTAE